MLILSQNLCDTMLCRLFFIRSSLIQEELFTHHGFLKRRYTTKKYRYTTCSRRPYSMTTFPITRLHRQEKDYDSRFGNILRPQYVPFWGRFLKGNLCSKIAPHVLHTVDTTKLSCDISEMFDSYSCNVPFSLGYCQVWSTLYEH